MCLILLHQATRSLDSTHLTKTFAGEGFYVNTTICSRRVPDVYPMHNESTNSADPPLGVLNLFPVKVLLHIDLSGSAYSQPFQYLSRNIYFMISLFRYPQAQAQVPPPPQVSLLNICSLFQFSLTLFVTQTHTNTNTHTQTHTKKLISCPNYVSAYNVLKIFTGFLNVDSPSK